MDEKKPSLWDKVIKLMGEKGFYIVLFLCVAVIGVSGWMILSSVEAPEEAGEPLSVTVSVPAPTERETAARPPVITERPAPQPAEEPLPPAPEPEDAPAEETVLPEPPTVEPSPAEPSSALPDTVPEPPSETLEVLAPLPNPEPEPLPAAMIWPLNGPVETPHSLDALVYDRTMADWRTHNGLDLAAALGAKVQAAADGMVEQVYADTRLGTTVVILHSGGLRSVYANLAELPAVSAGQMVSMGDVIGAVGETAMAEIGNVTHLHFAMTLEGAPVDPRDLLPGG